MTRFFAALLAALVALPFLGISAWAQESYRIRPGDTLRIEVLQDPGLNRTVLVSPDGRVSFPLAGGLQASRRTLEQVQADLATRLAPNFAAAPTVFVALEQVAETATGTGTGAPEVAMIDLFVLGEVENSGKIEVERGTTALQAFAQMGGFSNFAATRRVQLRRGGKTYTLNYDAIERGTSNAGATVLQDGDVIVVPQRRLFE